MPADTLSLNKFRLALEALTEDRDRHMNAAEVLVFIWCAMRPGVTMAQLQELAGGISQSEASRIVAKFSTYEGGYGLLRAEEDLHERRRKIVRLTPKGARVAEKLVQFMQ